MADIPGDGLSEGRLDLVPMIDCIMLLLLFFMLTTRFTPEEKTIQNLLPADTGHLPRPHDQVDPPKLVFINITPAGIAKDSFESERQTHAWILDQQRRHPDGVFPVAEFRIGTRPRAEQLERRDLAERDTALMSPHLARIHRFIHEELAQLEIAGQDRAAQPRVVVQCFSGLSWQYALVAYDAVRSYELGRDPAIQPPFTPEVLARMRPVDFAPPRLRDFKAWDLGNELFQILRSSGE